MSDKEDSGKATEPATRSGKTYNKNKKSTNREADKEVNVQMDNKGEEGTMDAESNDVVMETRETTVDVNGRDPIMLELMRALTEMRRELNEIKSVINQRPSGSHTRSKQTIRYGDAEIPVNIETGSEIGNDGESDNKEPTPAVGSGGSGENGGNGGNNGQITLRIPRSGWVKDPFEELKYYGETDKTNPVIFLRRFENVAQHEGIPRDQQLYDFRRVLKGAAKHWIEAIDPIDIETAKKLFLEMYWGRAAQKIFRKFIHNGQYQPNRGTSMSEYALNIIHQCQMLKPRMSDNDIIEMLEDHFEENVAREIRPSTVSNLTDLIILLKRIESTRNKKPYEGDLYRFDAKIANRTGNNGQRPKANANTQVSLYKKGGQRDNNTNDRNTIAKPISNYTVSNPSRSYVPNAFRGRNNNGNRFAYPRRDGRSTVTITEVHEDEPEKGETSNQMTRPAISWQGNARKESTTPNYNKATRMDSRSSGYQKKRISVVTGDKENTDRINHEEETTDARVDSGEEPNLNIIRTKRILDDLDDGRGSQMQEIQGMGCTDHHCSLQDYHGESTRGYGSASFSAYQRVVSIATIQGRGNGCSADKEIPAERSVYGERSRDR